MLNRYHPLARHLIAWWPTIKARHHTTLFSYDNQALNGDLQSGVTWAGAPYQFVGALDFNQGITAYVRLAGRPVPSGGSEITVAFWAYFRTLTTGVNDFDYLFHISNSNQGWAARINENSGANAQELHFFIGDGAAYRDFFVGVPTLNEWHHHTFTYDGANYFYYLDGVQSANTSITFTPNWGTSALTNHDIGDDAGDNADWQLVEPMVFDTAITGQMAWGLYNPPTRFSLYQPKRRKVGIAPVAADPEGPLVGGKLISGGILQGRLVR